MAARPKNASIDPQIIAAVVAQVLANGQFSTTAPVVEAVAEVDPVEALLNERRTKRGKAPVWLTRFNKPLDEAVNEAQPTLWGGPGETCDEGHCHT